MVELVYICRIIFMNSIICGVGSKFIFLRLALYCRESVGQHILGWYPYSDDRHRNSGNIVIYIYIYG